MQHLQDPDRWKIRHAVSWVQQDPEECVMFARLAAVCKLDRFGIIMTSNGPVSYSPGDFLVWGLAGEKFVCRGERFLRAFPAYIGRHSSAVV